MGGKISDPSKNKWDKVSLNNFMLTVHKFTKINKLNSGQEKYASLIKKQQQRNKKQVEHKPKTPKQYVSKKEELFQIHSLTDFTCCEKNFERFHKSKLKKIKIKAKLPLAEILILVKFYSMMYYFGTEK